MGDEILGHREGDPPAGRVDLAIGVRQQLRRRVEFGMIDLRKRSLQIAEHRIGKTVEHMRLGSAPGPAVMLGQRTFEPCLELFAHRRLQAGIAAEPHLLRKAHDGRRADLGRARELSNRTEQRDRIVSQDVTGQLTFGSRHGLDPAADLFLDGLFDCCQMRHPRAILRQGARVAQEQIVTEFQILK